MSGQEDDSGLLQLKADLSELIGLTQGMCVRVCDTFECICVIVESTNIDYYI